MYQTAKLFGVPFSELVWAARHERGELFGREHYHWLIGGKSIQPTKSNYFQLNALWDSFPKAGFSRNYPYDANQAGVDYICKCLSSPANTGREGQNSYESGKFGWLDSEVTLSNSLQRSVGGSRIIVERCCRAPRPGIAVEASQRRAVK